MEIITKNYFQKHSRRNLSNLSIYKKSKDYEEVKKQTERSLQLGFPYMVGGGKPSSFKGVDP